MYTAVQQLQENGIFRQLDEREIASVCGFMKNEDE